MALSRNERFVYFQVSFFHGFVEYDLRTDRVTRVADLQHERCGHLGHGTKHCPSRAPCLLRSIVTPRGSGVTKMAA